MICFFHLSAAATCSLIAIFLLSGCSSILRPEADKLAPWTSELESRQPEDAFAAIYLHNGKRLIVVGAHHATDVKSATFRLIDGLYEQFQVQTAIVEGAPYSRGPNDARLLAYVANHNEVGGFQSGGETVPAVRDALARGAAVWGGEPDDAEILARTRASGASDADILGFYTLRSIPQWVRERKIENTGDPALVGLIEKDLNRNRERLGLPPSVLADYNTWLQWYLISNQRRRIADFDSDEVAPFADGTFLTNRIAARIGRAREGYLLELIARHLNAGENLVVTFGESHLMILRPALDAMLGQACYVGNDAATAARSCR
jgi:hypothetical protein